MTASNKAGAKVTVGSSSPAGSMERIGQDMVRLWFRFASIIVVCKLLHTILAFGDSNVLDNVVFAVLQIEKKEPPSS